MNARENEEYLREYSILKSQGKPFFPYAIMKDSTMALITIGVIILMSILFGAELGPKADPTTTTYTPRPEWYFFFLFELLRVVKPPALVFLATIGIPTLCLVLLLMLPFFDRSPERNPLRRPIATVGRHRDDRGDGLPDGPRGALAGAPTEIEPGHLAPIRGGQGDHGVGRLPGLPQDRRERQHARPQPDRDRRPARQGRDRPHAVNPTPPMPSFRTLQTGEAGAVQQARRVRRVAQGRELVRQRGRPRLRDAARDAGARDVRPHRRASTTA